MRNSSVFLIVPLFAALAGCVSEPVPQIRTNLIVTRAGGTSQIQWQSVPGKIYSVYYADRVGAGANWKIVPGGAKLLGNGQLIRLEDHPPAGQPRYYDLRIDYSK